MKGTIVRWGTNENGRPLTYGFVKPDTGDANVFLHYTNLRGEGYRYPCIGDVVEFEVQETERGLQAVNCRLIEN